MDSFKVYDLLPNGVIVFKNEKIAYMNKHILDIMNLTDLGYKNAIILNISDICETTSSKFAKEINELNYSDVGAHHSIFSDLRNDELSTILNNFSGDTVILASGVNYKLRFLTKQMLNKIQHQNIVSIQHKNGQFYHPLPRSAKEAWVSEIVKKIKLTKTRGQYEPGSGFVLPHDKRYGKI